PRIARPPRISRGRLLTFRLRPSVIRRLPLETNTLQAIFLAGTRQAERIRRMILARLGARGIVRAAMALAAAGPLRAERLPVLKQIDEPHPYYYREMYLPQVTSGPSGAAWSPDGKELVYAMQGTLWRQRVGTREAVQLTDGPGYDSE